MKKVLRLLIVACLCCGMLVGCEKKEKLSGINQELNDSTESMTEVEFQGYCFQIPADWEAGENTDELLYYYPQNGMLMIAYSPMDQSITDDQARSDFLTAFGSSMDSYELTGESEEYVAGTIAYRDTMNISAAGEEWNTQMVTFDCEGGIINFSMYSLVSANTDYTDDLNGILASLEKVENGAASSGAAQGSVDAETVRQDVDVKVVPTADGLMCAFITNNSEVTIDELGLQINYKDDTGTTIDMDEDWHDMVLPGSTVVSRLDAPEQYADYEVQTSVELGVHSTYENHAEKVEVKSNQGDKCIIVEITNNADVDIDEIEYIAVLYQGDEIVTVEYSQDIYEVSAGETVTEKIDTYSEEYDSFEIYLNQAHTFGF